VDAGLNESSQADTQKGTARPKIDSPAKLTLSRATPTSKPAPAPRGKGTPPVSPTPPSSSGIEAIADMEEGDVVSWRVLRRNGQEDFSLLETGIGYRDSNGVLWYWDHWESDKEDPDFLTEEQYKNKMKA